MRGLAFFHVGKIFLYDTGLQILGGCIRSDERLSVVRQKLGDSRKVRFVCARGGYIFGRDMRFGIIKSCIQSSRLFTKVSHSHMLLRQIKCVKNVQHNWTCFKLTELFLSVISSYAFMMGIKILWINGQRSQYSTIGSTQ